MKALRIRKLKLIKIRDKEILRLRNDGLYLDEIATIFNLGQSRVCQIIRKVEANKK